KADAEKQAAILHAEAERQAAVLRAEGEAEAIMKVQTALADSIKLLNSANPNDQVVKLKALESFEKAADGQATKIIVPSEIQSLAGLAASFKGLLEDEKK
ncbi:MAG: peptidase, partial [Oscillospiraceae bacterium]|nr:peptidase [Oscillospiraceae bacterium]